MKIPLLLLPFTSMPNGWLCYFFYRLYNIRWTGNIFDSLNFICLHASSFVSKAILRVCSNLSSQQTLDKNRGIGIFNHDGNVESPKYAKSYVLMCAYNKVKIESTWLDSVGCLKINSRASYINFAIRWISIGTGTRFIWRDGTPRRITMEFHHAKSCVTKSVASRQSCLYRVFVSTFYSYCSSYNCT